MGLGEQVVRTSRRADGHMHTHTSRVMVVVVGDVSQGAFKWRVQVCLCSGVMWSRARPLKLRTDSREEEL